MPKLELIELATKQVKRTEYTKHPFSKKRLRVLDIFSPVKRVQLIQEDIVSLDPELAISCPTCTAPADKIMVVESDISATTSDLSDALPPTPPAPPYYVISCATCNSQTWYVILS